MLFKHIILFLFALFLIYGCDNVTGVDEKFYENVNARVYFCPQDDCEQVLIDNINSAQKSVHCAFYDLDLKGLIKEIGEKSYEADVRIVVDHGNYDGQIKGPGIKIAKSKQYMHNKFCVIDDSKVITGSMNPTDNGAKLNNNNLIIINSKYIAENYEDEFDELWNGVYASGEKIKFDEVNTNLGVIENYFCPEDCNNGAGALNRVINLIKNAEKSVKIASFSFTQEDIADELLKADINGVDVTVLIERRQRNVQKSQYTRLKDFGIDIKVDGNKGNMHHKFIIIDDKIVITGSPNYSFSGFNRNDENMLIFHNRDMASKFSEEFDKLFVEGEVI